MVIDRIFLVLFCLACLLGKNYFSTSPPFRSYSTVFLVFAGTTTIILQAPTLYDKRLAIDEGDQILIQRMNGIKYCREIYNTLM